MTGIYSQCQVTRAELFHAIDQNSNLLTVSDVLAAIENERKFNKREACSQSLQAAFIQRKNTQ